MKTILVATDFSVPAQNALRYAAALAASLKARIVLFNAFQLPLHASNTLLSPAGVDELIAANNKRLEIIAEKTAAEFNIEVTGFSKYVLLTDVLDELVAEVNASLIVIGMHENDWADQLFGNTTTAVVRAATYPVLVVPEKAVFKSVEKILYAFDGNYLSGSNNLPTLKEIAAGFGASVEVFSVRAANSNSYAGEATPDHHPIVEAALAHIEHSYKNVVNENVVEEIVHEVGACNADMLAVVPHKFKMWERFVRSSTTRALALKTQIPLLVLPNVEEGVAMYN